MRTGFENKKKFGHFVIGERVVGSNKGIESKSFFQMIGVNKKIGRLNNLEEE